MEFSSRIITYGDLRKGVHFENDKYGIASYEYETRRKTFLSNPCAGADDDVFMYLVEADGVPVGRTMLFDTRLKVGNDIVPLYSGSALKVEDEFQKYGLGGEIFAFGGTIEKRKLNLSAGISDMALPLYKVMKNSIFEFPKMLRLQNTKPLLGKFGTSGILQSFLGGMANFFLHTYYLFSHSKTNKLKKRYVLEKIATIPLWVDDIVLNDGHKYMEVHDHKWLQWCLDNSFKGGKQDIQSFYIIKKEDESVGFVMTKERLREETQGMKNVKIGSIVEWGSRNEKELCEADIYRLVLDTFSKDVDIIETATNDSVTKLELKRMGFFHHGDAHIAFKDKTKQLTDSSDVSLWRLRYGYADVILN